MSSSTAWARAHSNIALIKYWGKRDAALNLPAVGSISLTLDNLYTDTRVRFDPALAEDSLSLDGAAPTADKRTTAFLDRVRAQAGIATRARHRDAMLTALESLTEAQQILQRGPEFYDIAAEEMRSAIRALELLVGRIGVENLLDEIFSSFCLGK